MRLKKCSYFISNNFAKKERNKKIGKTRYKSLKHQFLNFGQFFKINL